MKAQRKILHIDMDCFFAAVEMRDDPSLRNVPLAIGGSPTGRGVLSTCNYEARKYGLRSAMSSAQALKLCPHVKFIRGNFSKYKEASQGIKEIFGRFTDIIEPLSLDEAYLDVSQSEEFYGSATLLAQEIRRLIKKELGLTASAGVSFNKFLAKVASDWRKPDGLFVVKPEDAYDFSQALKVRKFPGVGSVTESKLLDLGISTGADITQNEALIVSYFGKSANGLIRRAKGICHSPVGHFSERKSLSAERTYRNDLSHFQELKDNIPLILDEVVYRVQSWKERKDPSVVPYNMFVKVKFSDFSQVTQEKSFDFSFFDSMWQKGEVSTDMLVELTNLLEMAYQKGIETVRLLGMGFKFKSLIQNDIDRERPYQMELFEGHFEKAG